MSRRARTRADAEASKWVAWQTERDEDQDAPELPEPEGDEQHRPEGEQVWK